MASTTIFLICKLCEEGVDAQICQGLEGSIVVKVASCDCAIKKVLDKLDKLNDTEEAKDEMED